MLKRGPGKTAIREGTLNLASGNITGIYDRMISEKWCKAEPDYRSSREGLAGKMIEFPAKREGQRGQ